MRDYNVSNDDFEWRMYNVRKFDDKGVTISTPYAKKMPHPWNDRDDGNNDGSDNESNSDRNCDKGKSACNRMNGPLSMEDVNVFVNRTQSFMENLSKSTHLPAIALGKMFPVQVVHDIILELKSNPVYSGLHSNNSELPAPITDLCKDVEDFSFWLATNLPLSQSEKLDILETFALVERLQLILRFMRKRTTAYIRCAQCRGNIALVGRIFKVEGAEGASGAYVNEYGVVHQTTTLLDVVENSVICEGSPEARDR